VSAATTGKKPPASKAPSKNQTTKRKQNLKEAMKTLNQKELRNDEH